MRWKACGNLNGLAFSIAGSAISEFSFSNLFVRIMHRISPLEMWLQKLFHHVHHANKCWVQISKFIIFACMLLFYFLPFWTHYHKRLVVFYNIFLPIVNVFHLRGLWGLDNVLVIKREAAGKLNDFVLQTCFVQTVLAIRGYFLFR